MIPDIASIARYRDKNDNPDTTIKKLQPCARRPVWRLKPKKRELHGIGD